MRSRYPQTFGMFAVLLATLATSALAQSTTSATTGRIQELSYQFEEAGLAMEYQLYLPSTYDAATPSPLIVLLHGLGSNPGQIIRYQGLTDLAEERGYIVVAPMGYNERGWYGSGGPGVASLQGAELDELEKRGELSEMDGDHTLIIARDPDNVRAIFDLFDQARRN